MNFFFCYGSPACARTKACSSLEANLYYYRKCSVRDDIKKSLSSIARSDLLRVPGEIFDPLFL